MKTIWKYALAITDEQKIDMPRGAKILIVANQGITLCLWVMVDPDEPPVTRYVNIVGTGNPVSEDYQVRTFIGTVLMPPFVWHVFEVL